MDPNLKSRLIFAGIALLAVLSIGTIGFYITSEGDYSVFTCFFMTVVTVTTIGYEAIKLENYPAARAFTIFLAFAGSGLLTYFVSTVSAFIIEGHLRQTYLKRKMEKSIINLEDHYIICGVGRHSLHLIEELSATKRNSVFIELDPNVIHLAMKQFPMQKYIQGDATHDDILLKAGVKKAKGLFATTTEDNLNLVISLSAKLLNPKIKIVSLCVNHDNQDKMKLAGADITVSPNYIGGMRMASEMLRPIVTSFLDTMLRDKDKNLRIEQVDLDDKYIGKTIGDLRLNDFKESLLIGIRCNDELIFKPQDDYVINKGDCIILMTTPDERIRLENFIP